MATTTVEAAPPGVSRARGHHKSSSSSSAGPSSLVAFSKLDERALWTYIGHHHVPGVKPHASRADLAVVCSRHFCTWQVDEESVLDNLVSSRSCGGTGVSFKREIGEPGRGRKRSLYEGEAGLMSPRSAKLSKNEGIDSLGSLIAGEKVAAKITQSDENGSWILATVTRYFASQSLYEVADEDDSSHKYIIGSSNIVRLTNNVDKLQKGDPVLAVFPETTIFYRGKVGKAPKRGAIEVFVQFEDDEDETGKTPNRRVPANLVTQLLA